MGNRVPATAEMDDGRVLKVFIDQRDYAAVEAEEINPATHRNTYVRFVTWAALKRTKQYSGTWAEFNAKDCVEAIDGEPEGSDDTERLDPGQQAPSAGA